MYPNPVRDKLNVYLPTNFATSNFTIYDISGRVVLTASVAAGVIAISLPKLSSGIYTYSIRTGKAVKQQGKLLIEN